MEKRGPLAGLILAAVVIALFPAVTCQPTRYIELASRSVEGGVANSHCYLPDLSADGRYVAFESDATNVVEDDTNNARDVFLFDTWDSSLERVSVSDSGAQADGPSGFAFITPDGRFIGFMTLAPNLVPYDNNGKSDAVVHDVLTGKNTIVSRSASGELGNDDSSGPVVSADGHYAVFNSAASNLVPNDNNSFGAGIFSDVFVKDTVTGEIERISLGYDGSEANQGFWHPNHISPDGRYVVLRSAASNLVPGDTNGRTDVFIHDRLTHLTERVNVSSEGEQDNGYIDAFASPHVSPDGRFVAFASWSTVLTGGVDRNMQVFLRDRELQTTEWVQVSRSSPWFGGWAAESPDISADARYVVFDSIADRIVPDDEDLTANIFRYDRQTGEYIMVDRDVSGKQFAISKYPRSSTDGKTVAFESWGPGGTPYSQIYVAIGLP